MTGCNAIKELREKIAIPKKSRLTLRLTKMRKIIGNSFAASRLFSVKIL
jgi:hypothetical protein